MQRNILVTLGLALVAHGAAVQAQNWNPKPGWKDSYAVGGRCYCDSNGYDHNLDTKTASTPVGVKNVVTICEDIERVLGSGPTSGRIPYNDIQCGNGPANDAPDESGCPGRVDIGNAGCNVLGPKWDLAAVYGSPPPAPNPLDGALSRNGWKLSASSDANNLTDAIDGNPSSRWATRTPQAAGQFFQVDMGKLNSFDRIVLDPANNPDDYPRSYQVLVSKDGSNWTGPVAKDQGDSKVTDIRFPQQSARYVRIEQSGSASKNWWSIGEINILLSGASLAGKQALSSKGWVIYASSNPLVTTDTIDGKASSRWSTSTRQQPGQFLQIDMMKNQRIDHIVLDSQGNPLDYPRGYKVYASNDAVEWGEPIATGIGTQAVTNIQFSPRNARYIRIEQTGSDSNHWWSVHELTVYQAVN